MKGNFNLSDPRHILDALNMDLIGMSAGNEKFQQLSQYPVLLRFEKQDNKPLGFLKRLKRFISKIFNFPFFKVNYIMGGSRYFKTRSAIN